MVTRQIANLRTRIILIRRIQMMAVSGCILCALSMFLIFIKMDIVAQIVFGCSLSIPVVSLYEIVISTRAIEIEMEDMELGLEQHH